jgi:hypothetical protein
MHNYYSMQSISIYSTPPTCLGVITVNGEVHILLLYTTLETLKFAESIGLKNLVMHLIVLNQ